jgi:hypothetical protein
LLSGQWTVLSNHLRDSFPGYSAPC